MSSIMDKLGEMSVVYFQLEQDNTSMVITEACDIWHEAHLNKEQVSLLITELEAMRDEMYSSVPPHSKGKPTEQEQ